MDVGDGASTAAEGDEGSRLLVADAATHLLVVFWVGYDFVAEAGEDVESSLH